MSNIIDGIDYGMGYEPTKEWGIKNQFHTNTFEGWVGSACPDQAAMDREIKTGVRYRRPLPIISQHPGAIPLEPGEELREWDNYLMRDGRETGPIPFDGHETFPFGLDGDQNTWTKYGECWPSEKSDNDIIARLPKVESKDPEEKQDGDKCGQPGCHGVYEFKKSEKCFCHLSPPCAYCVPMPISCGNCGYTPNREILEPEKAKEEKVEEETVECITIVERREGLVKRMTVTEAARIYLENPSVQAEVERQRKEREIKVGDWVAMDGGPVFKVGQKDGGLLTGGYVSWVKEEFCTKITDPAFIALLEKGVRNE